jgi:RimJ/RimL family protein N-acetyltransferase
VKGLPVGEEKSVTDAKERLLETLPIQEGDLTVRRCTREDYECFAAWPPYPPHFECFRFSFADLPPTERDRVFEERYNRSELVQLTVDRGEDVTVAYVNFQKVDWAAGTIDNMAIRVHPSFCDQGIGTAMMIMIRDWWWRQGMGSLRLDVAGPNTRAQRCYEKVGFVRTGEIWRADKELAGVDLSRKEYDWLRDHVRDASGVPEIRFLLMECRK